MKSSSFVLFIAVAAVATMASAMAASANLRGGASSAPRELQQRQQRQSGTKKQRKARANAAIARLTEAQKAAIFNPIKTQIVDAAKVALTETKSRFGKMPRWKRTKHHKGNRKLDARQTLRARLNAKFAGMAADGALAAAEQAVLVPMLESYDAALPEAFTTAACTQADAELTTTKGYFDRLVADNMDAFDASGSAVQGGLGDVQDFEEDVGSLYSTMGTMRAVLLPLQAVPAVGASVFKPLRKALGDARTLLSPFKTQLSSLTTNVVDPLEAKLTTLLEKNEAAAEHIEAARYAAQKYVVEPARFLDGHCAAARPELGNVCSALRGTLAQANGELATFEETMGGLKDDLKAVSDFVSAVATLLANEAYADVMSLLEGLSGVLAPFRAFLDTEVCIGFPVYDCFTFQDVLDGLGYLTDILMYPLELALDALGVPSISLDMFGLPALPSVDLGSINVQIDMPNLGLPDLGIGICNANQQPVSGDAIAALKAGTRGPGGLPAWLLTQGCRGSPFANLEPLTCPTPAPTHAPTSSPTPAPTPSPTPPPTPLPFPHARSPEYAAMQQGCTAYFRRLFGATGGRWENKWLQGLWTSQDGRGIGRSVEKIVAWCEAEDAAARVSQAEQQQAAAAAALAAWQAKWRAAAAGLSKRAVVASSGST